MAAKERERVGEATSGKRGPSGPARSAKSGHGATAAPPRKLLLLDGHSLAYRAFYALPTDLATKAGTITNAVYGFTAMLTKVLADEQPTHIAVAFDTPKPTFRYELDPEYKANRKETPDVFSAQLPLIREVLDTLQIPVLEVEGVEADDVIATLATRAADDAMDVVVVTGDRDTYQLVEDPHVKVLYNRRGVSDYMLYDEAGIEERTGVTPARYTEYAALRGDTSDNLPGVPGIGEKTAAKLVAAYGTLEEIFEHLDDLPPRQRQNLGEARDRVFKNREMSILRRDVDVGVDATDLRQGAFDKEALRTLCNQLEFKTLLPRLLEAIGEVAEIEEAATLDVDVRTLTAPDAAAGLLREVAASKDRYALAARWAGEAGRSDVVGLGVATADGASAYIASELLVAPEVHDALRALVADGGPPLVAHRAKELMHGLPTVDVRTLDLDTAVMAYLLDPGEGRYVLGELALRYLGVELTSPDVEEGTLDLDGNAGVDETARHAAATLRLAGTLEEALEARELTDLYERFERPLVRVLAKMEEAGVRIDVGFLAGLSTELAARCRTLEAQIYDAAGETFNINSTPQLRAVLFDKLGLTPVKRTKTGPSTDADSLQKMAALEGAPPLLDHLLKYREVDKLRSTYADALPPLVGSDGRIHATFNQVATTTGRISSESPNLQNIPVRTSEGREMRRAFVADTGCLLLSADYSQIELRIIAHLTDDPGLVEAFTSGTDVHTVTAARVFDVPEAKVDEFQRRFAKVVNYGLAYGMEAYGLGQRLDIPTDQAREILDSYFESFPNVAEFMQSTVAEAKARGFTTTIFGRRRQLPELASPNFRIRQMGERMAQNAPVQGSAADVFKLAMIEVDRMLETEGFEARMILTVHDELVFETPEGELARLEARVREVMEGVCDLSVPLVVDTGSGPSWADCK